MAQYDKAMTGVTNEPALEAMLDFSGSGNFQKALFKIPLVYTIATGAMRLSLQRFNDVFALQLRCKLQDEIIGI